MSAPMRKSVGGEQPIVGSGFWEAEPAGRASSMAGQSLSSARLQETAELMSRPASPDDKPQASGPAHDPDQLVFDPDSWEAGPTEEATGAVAVGSLRSAKVPDFGGLEGAVMQTDSDPPPAAAPALSGTGRRSQNPARALLGASSPGPVALPSTPTKPARRESKPQESSAAPSQPTQAAATPSDRPVPPPLPRRQKPASRSAVDRDTARPPASSPKAAAPPASSPSAGEAPKGAKVVSLAAAEPKREVKPAPAAAPSAPASFASEPAAVAPAPVSAAAPAAAAPGSPTPSEAVRTAEPRAATAESIATANVVPVATTEPSREIAAVPKESRPEAVAAQPPRAEQPAATQAAASAQAAPKSEPVHKGAERPSPLPAARPSHHAIPSHAAHLPGLPMDDIAEPDRFDDLFQVARRTITPEIIERRRRARRFVLWLMAGMLAILSLAALIYAWQHRAQARRRVGVEAGETSTMLYAADRASPPRAAPDPVRAVAPPDTLMAPPVAAAPEPVSPAAAEPSPHAPARGRPARTSREPHSVARPDVRAAEIKDVVPAAKFGADTPTN
jgi:hypothetical protein